MSDLLSQMKDIRDDLESVDADQLPPVTAARYGRAINKFVGMIADGERKIAEKLRAGLRTVNPDSSSPDPDPFNSAGPDRD